ncbi:hypothetical protein ACWEQC_40690 [Streptomyces shenzhenensis]
MGGLTACRRPSHRQGAADSWQAIAPFAQGRRDEVAQHHRPPRRIQPGTGQFPWLDGVERFVGVAGAFFG